jgi:iron complex outermembrane receptor protein
MGRLSLSATFTHTDRQVTSVGSVAAFAQGAIPYDGGISPPTDLLNLNVNWNHVGNSPIDVGFFASNVTDQKYFVGIGGGLSSIGADNLVLGSPRMFGFRLKYHFGD